MSLLNIDEAVTLKLEHLAMRNPEGRVGGIWLVKSVDQMFCYCKRKNLQTCSLVICPVVSQKLFLPAACSVP